MSETIQTSECLCWDCDEEEFICFCEKCERYNTMLTNNLRDCHGDLGCANCQTADDQE